MKRSGGADCEIGRQGPCNLFAALKIPSAEARDIRLLLENHSDFRVSEYQSIIEEVGADRVGVFLDIINPISGFEDPCRSSRHSPRTPGQVTPRTTGWHPSRPTTVITVADFRSTGAIRAREPQTCRR